MADNLILNGYFTDIKYDSYGTDFINTQMDVGHWHVQSGSVRFLKHGHSSLITPLPDELKDSATGFVCLNGDQEGLIHTQTTDALKDGDKLFVSWWASVDNHPACEASQAAGYQHSVQLATGFQHASGDDGLYDGADLKVNRLDGWRNFKKLFTVKGDGKKYLSFKGDPHSLDCGVVISGVTVGYDGTGTGTLAAKLLQLDPQTYPIGKGRQIPTGTITVTVYDDVKGTHRLESDVRILLQLTPLNGGPAVFTDANEPSITITATRGLGRVPAITAGNPGMVQLSATAYGVVVSDTMTITIT